MKPIYLDLHIHTSRNAGSLNENYNVDLLLEKIKAKINGENYLIPLTDHNTINKQAYAKLIQKTQNYLLGVESHIKYAENCPPYHCHIYFNNADSVFEQIDDINLILDRLYPVKEITPNTEHIPSLEEIINAFDKYDFLLLPHGEQSHRTFDTAVPEGTMFDNTLERLIYYNQFDGFTARGNTGLERTKRYFSRLGISSFVNLITSSDNYDLTIYPDFKDPQASPFIPTWMYALPDFNGLRISLSEESRFTYTGICPEDWSEYLKKVTLNNDKIKIDVEFTAGLNVVIGGSSSGKTLFVDSIARKLQGTMEKSVYGDFHVNEINIDNPSGKQPHYIPQNYITEIFNGEKNSKDISDIEIIKNVFRGNAELERRIELNFEKLRNDLGKLINSVADIEECIETFNHIPIISRLLLTENAEVNIISLFMPNAEIVDFQTFGTYY
ncbi:MAG: hypothetical protein GX317_12455 [Staphylococcus equorum]|nr:hypothetical protein [Staphylococcus equorum]